MKVELNSILEFISHYVDLYYIIPFIFAFIVLYVQWKKGNKYLLSLTFFSFEIFSITTSFEYIFIFLFTESLPKSIALLDKIILFFGTLIAFLIIFLHTTEGSWIGNRIDDILNKYLLPKPMLMPVSPFAEQLEKLKQSREEINTGNKDQVNNSYQIFLENGSSIIMSLTKNSNSNHEDITQIQTQYNTCKENFEYMCHGQTFEGAQIVKTAGSVSVFIGLVGGFTNS